MPMNEFATLKRLPLCSDTICQHFLAMNCGFIWVLRPELKLRAEPQLALFGATAISDSIFRKVAEMPMEHRRRFEDHAQAAHHAPGSIHLHLVDIRVNDLAIAYPRANRRIWAFRISITPWAFSVPIHCIGSGTQDGSD